MRRFSKSLVLLALISALAVPCAIASPFDFEGDTITVTRDVSRGADMELVQNEVSIDDAEIEPINTKKVKDTVVPDAHKEGKKVIGLFLKAMAMVVFCAAILCFIFVFVKKFFASAFINRDFEELESLDLSTPSTREDAVHSFLNRTK